MGSGWKVGKVDLYAAPKRVIYKLPHSIKKVPVLIERPWLMSHGGDTIQLAWEGEIFDTTKSLPTLFDEYCVPLIRYSKQPSAFPQILMDEVATDFWDSHACPVFKVTGDLYKKGDESLYVQFGITGYIYRDFTEDKNYSKHNFASFWHRGTGSEKYKITFYNETGKTNGYRAYSTASDNNWTQFFATPSTGDHADTFGTVGTPTGWSKIRSVVIETSGNVTASGRFDRLGMGIGWKVEDPNSLYNGIYMIANFQVEEGDGNIESFNYRLNLMDTTEYYGE